MPLHARVKPPSDATTPRSTGRKQLSAEVRSPAARESEGT